MKTKRIAAASSSSALEEEGRRMEERLQMLRKMMSVEKASRELSCGRYWKSSGSNSDSLSPSQSVSDQDSVRAKGSVRVIRVLTNEDEGGPLKAKKCGQCDKPSAKLACVECVENYCLSCFAKFHQKGALSKHRVRPIKVKGPTKTKRLPITTTTTSSQSTGSTQTVGGDSQTPPQPIGKTGTCSTRTSGATGSEEEGVQPVMRREGGGGGDREGGAGSLWEGQYDEKASARSFQEALQEWRAGRSGTKCGGGSVCPSTTQACGTQTTSSSTRTPINPSDDAPKTDAVNFSKYSGGVSYLEKLLVRRHLTHPPFLASTSTHPTTGEREHNISSGREGANDCDVNTTNYSEQCEQESLPSRYNLFHSHSSETGASDTPWYLYASSASPVSYNRTNNPPLRPSSSVQIEEVRFGDNHQTTENVTVAGSSVTAHAVSQSGENKSEASKHKQLKQRGEREKRCPQHQKAKARKAFQEGIKKKEELPDIAKKLQTASQDYSTAVDHQSGRPFSMCIRNILQPHSKAGISNISTEGMLSEFFLSGVRKDLEEEEEKKTEDDGGEFSNCKFSKPSLPLSSSVWLPQNSVLTDDVRREESSVRDGPVLESASMLSNDPACSGRAPNPLLLSQLSPKPPLPLLSACSPNPPSHHDAHHNPLLRQSIYCIETDLPPPRCSVSTRQEDASSRTPPHAHSVSAGHRHEEDDTESESDTDGPECFRENIDEEELNMREGYGEDLEALEELAWELQSLTGGRETRCEGEEGDEEEEDGGELEGGDGGEGKWGNLEAEMERVKSSLEVYHQQLMQQDSD